MTLQIYDVTIPVFVKFLGSVQNILKIANDYCVTSEISEQEIIGARLNPNMLPFSYQIKSATIHSIGAIRGVQRGTFSPDNSQPADSFTGLSNQVDLAIEELSSIQPEDIDYLLGSPLLFRLGQHSADFSVEQFLLTFSIPNFYFHVTTAYGILRMKGIEIGKVDYLGRLPLTRS